MTKNVQITIRSIQMMGQQKEQIEQVAKGSFYEKNGTCYLVYDEAAEGGEEKISTMVKLKPDSIEITKKGAITALMVFQENTEYVTRYGTFAGELIMRFRTGRLWWQKRENGLEAEIQYKLDINGAYVSDCSIYISAVSEICEEERQAEVVAAKGKQR